MPQTAPNPDDLEALRRENAELKRELTRLHEADQRAAERRAKAVKTAGSFLLPLMDRQRVVRSFMELVETAAAYAGPREQWPTRAELEEKAKLFALSFMRFVVRRRVLVFFFSLLAFTVPALQVYVAIQQNRIIENQNKYFNIQVYDIVARSITSGDLTAKQITTALLAREDFALLNGIIYQVFASESGGAFTAQDAVHTQPLILREAAARGHLVAALSQAIDRQAAQLDAATLWREIAPTLRFVLQDAAYRVPLVLRFEREATEADPAVTQESYRYLFSLGVLLRKAWSVAVTAEQEAAFFERVGRFLGAVSTFRAKPLSGQPFVAVFTSAMQELLVDVGLAPKLGEAAPELAADPQRVEALLKQGFERLRGGVGQAAGVNWQGLQRLVEVP